MYAIVEIAGQQFKVEKKQEIFVHRLEEKEGSKVEFSEVLLIDNDGKINVGTPVIKGAVVSAKVLEHLKADKVLVFKKKRRKGYQKLNGHRQYLSRILIDSILEKAPKASPKAEKEEKKPPVVKTSTAKPKPKAAAKPKAKKEEVKKAAPKTKAVKKASPKPKAEKPAPKTASKKAAPAKEAKPKATPKAKKADEKKEDK
ncbi:MAG: 50S ribosomal protein L21 [Bacteroidetes bacterium]|nr:50S ribosomal protein L21 [Bacteroidota bacterium]